MGHSQGVRDVGCGVWDGAWARALQVEWRREGGEYRGGIGDAGEGRGEIPLLGTPAVATPSPALPCPHSPALEQAEVCKIGEKVPRTPLRHGRGNRLK